MIQRIGQAVFRMPMEVALYNKETHIIGVSIILDPLYDSNVVCKSCIRPLAPASVVLDFKSYKKGLKDSKASKDTALSAIHSYKLHIFIILSKFY